MQHWYQAALVNHKKPPNRPKIDNQSIKSNSKNAHVPRKQANKQAIKKSKSSKALGPDDISPIMLKRLGPSGISFLSNFLPVASTNV